MLHWKRLQMCVSGHVVSFGGRDCCFLHETATSDGYTLSRPDALPVWRGRGGIGGEVSKEEEEEEEKEGGGRGVTFGHLRAESCCCALCALASISRRSDSIVSLALAVLACSAESSSDCVRFDASASIARSVSDTARMDDCKITSPSALRRLVSAEIDTPLEEQRGAI